jgi:hypothetical protein
MYVCLRVCVCLVLFVCFGLCVFVFVIRFSRCSLLIYVCFHVSLNLFRSAGLTSPAMPTELTVLRSQSARQEQQLRAHLADEHERAVASAVAAATSSATGGLNSDLEVKLSQREAELRKMISLVKTHRQSEGAHLLSLALSLLECSLSFSVGVPLLNHTPLPRVCLLAATLQATLVEQNAEVARLTANVEELTVKLEKVQQQALLFGRAAETQSHEVLRLTDELEKVQQQTQEAQQSNAKLKEKLTRSSSMSNSTAKVLLEMKTKLSVAKEELGSTKTRLKRSDSELSRLKSAIRSSALVGVGFVSFWCVCVCVLVCSMFRPCSAHLSVELSLYPSRSLVFSSYDVALSSLLAPLCRNGVAVSKLLVNRVH